MTNLFTLELVVAVLWIVTFLKAMEPIRPLSSWGIGCIIFFILLIGMIFYPHFLTT
jgi:hypothetical protein